MPLAALGIGVRDEQGRWRVHPAKLDALIEARWVLGLDVPAEADAAASDMSRGMRCPPRFIDRIAFRCPDAMAIAIQPLKINLSERQSNCVPPRRRSRVRGLSSSGTENLHKGGGLGLATNPGLMERR